MKILVLAPHPDDDVLGCGGSIINHLQKEDEVTVLFLTSGDAGDLFFSKEELASIRKQEARQAADVIGVKNLIFLDIPDGQIEYSQQNLIKIIEKIREVQPDIMYLPHAKEVHRDHANTFILGKEAIVRAAANSYQECNGYPWYVPTVLCYEVWTPLEEVQYIVDISANIDKKLEALREHISQIKNVQYDEAVQGLNRYRGAMTGKGMYCECFQVLRIDNL